MLLIFSDFQHCTCLRPIVRPLQWSRIACSSPAVLLLHNGTKRTTLSKFGTIPKHVVTLKQVGFSSRYWDKNWKSKTTNRWRQYSTAVHQLTIEQAHKEFNSLMDQIAAKSEQLDSGKFDAVDTSAFNAESAKLASFFVCMSQLY